MSAVEYVPYVETEGAKTNPDNTTVMADTGALPAGIYQVTVIASTVTAVAVIWYVQRRNAANDGNTGDVVTFYTNTMIPVSFTFKMQVTAGERIRVMTGGATVVAAANLLVQQVW